MDKKICKVIVINSEMRENFNFTKDKIYDAERITIETHGKVKKVFYIDNDFGRTVGFMQVNCDGGMVKVVEQCDN